MAHMGILYINGPAFAGKTINFDFFKPRLSVSFSAKLFELKSSHRQSR